MGFLIRLFYNIKYKKIKRDPELQL